MSQAINCIVCDKKIYETDKGMFDDGLVSDVSAGFGSQYDGSVFRIGVCDKCIARKRPKFVKDHFYPNQPDWDVIAIHNRIEQSAKTEPSEPSIGGKIDHAHESLLKIDAMNEKKIKDLEDSGSLCEEYTKCLELRELHQDYKNTDHYKKRIAESKL